MTDQELGLLEHVTYIDKNVLEIAFPGEGKEILEIKDTKTLKSVLKDFNEDALNNLRAYGDKTIDGAMMSGNEWADVIEQIKTNPNLNSLKVVKAEQYTNTVDDTYNLNICYSVPGTKQCIVTYKGTTGYDEWNDNVHGIVETDTHCQIDALNFYKEYTNNYDDVIVVGHSKGANKAMYVTIAADDDKISRCVAFDGQGFSNNFINTYDDKISDRAGLITNYYISTDFVHVLMKQIPGISEVSCQGYGMTNGAQYHSPNSFFKVGDNGKILLKDGSPIFVDEDEDEDIKLIRGFVAYVMDNCSDKELIEIADCLGPIAGAAIGEGDIKKAIIYMCSKPETLMKIRKLITAYAKENHLGRIDFAKLLAVFGVDSWSYLKLAIAFYIVMNIDPIVKQLIRAYDYIKELIDETLYVIQIADSKFREICSFLEDKVREVKERVNKFWSNVKESILSSYKNITGDIVRNYTSEFRDEIFELYNEIHHENLFDVAGFVNNSGWHTGFVDHICIDNNVDNINYIYRKIDEYDENVLSTIQDMFQKANQLDREYAKKIDAETEQIERLTTNYRIKLGLAG